MGIFLEGWRWGAALLSRIGGVVDLQARVDTGLLCRNLVRDCMRCSKILVAVVQLLVFEFAWSYCRETAPSSSRLDGLWITTGALPLVVFIIMVFWYRLYYTAAAIIIEWFWTDGPLCWLNPLGNSSTSAWYQHTTGKAFTLYIISWVVYVLVALIPRCGWLTLATTQRPLMPPGFLILTLVLNVCINVGYMFAVDGDAVSGSRRSILPCTPPRRA